MYTRFPLGSFDVVYAWYPSVLKGKVFYMLLLFCFVRFLDWLIRAPLHKSFQKISFLHRLWILSISELRYCGRELWKTGEAYSSVERIQAQYIWIKSLTGTCALFNCVIKCKRLLAFDIMLSICIFHLKSLLTVRPRVFA